MAETTDEVTAWTTLSDESWVAVHVPRFVEIRPRYVVYAGFLHAVLKHGCGTLAPLALIETRAKSIPSFAEKILRKRKSYMQPKGTLSPDPLARMTDLCGGRVIAQTSDQVRAVCQFIEEAFDVDSPNSEDVSQRLRPTEFGYRSVHYIVLVNAEKLRAAGVSMAIPPEVLGLKAEIQVRTLLEHAWADIGHEMTYKAEHTVPSRHSSPVRLAGRGAGGRGPPVRRVGAQFGRVQVQLRRLPRAGGSGGRDRPAADRALLRLGQPGPGGQDRPACAFHRPTRDGPGNPPALCRRAHQGVERVRGIALLEMHWDDPGGKEYVEGRRSLEAACAHRRQDAETLCALAESWGREDPSKARDLFHRAVAVDATEPITLSRYIEFEIAQLSDGAVVRLAAPMIRDAMGRCRKQIEARVNLPWAWASLGVLNLLVEAPYEALGALAQLIRLCGPPRSRRRHGWCRRAAFCRRPRPAAHARRSRPHSVHPREPAGLRLVPSGRSAGPGRWRERCRGGRRAILRMLASCGAGATPHLARGDTRASSSCPAAARRRPRARWTPSSRSGSARARGSPSPFSVADAQPISAIWRAWTALRLGPLQGWTDIVAAGVDPHRVKLLSYAGGQISHIECMLALALGARVGLIEDAAVPKDRQFGEPEWQDCPNLLRLPLDPMTLRAFLLTDQLPCKRDELAKAAQRSHEEHVQSVISQEPGLLPWKDLSEDLKLSNFHQVAYAENILNTAGLGVRPIGDPHRPLVDLQETLGEEGLSRLAEMEHGRWNVERLLSGWRHAEAKDVVKKLSPYLVPWNKLPPTFGNTT